jgi:hypothetical protein
MQAVTLVSQDQSIPGNQWTAFSRKIFCSMAGGNPRPVASRRL